MANDTEPPSVSVRPMTAEEFQLWVDEAVESYSQDVTKASGEPIEQTRERSREELAQLLPEGIDTPRTWLLKILDGDGTDVGVLWIGPQRDRPEVAYVYDITIHEQHQGRGLGRGAMQAAEQVVTAAGIGEIGLNVFGFNDRARRLYDSLGYTVVSTRMTKKLTDS